MAQEARSQGQEAWNTETQQADQARQELEQQQLRLDAEREELATTAVQLDEQRQALGHQARPTHAGYRVSACTNTWHPPSRCGLLHAKIFNVVGGVFDISSVDFALQDEWPAARGYFFQPKWHSTQE